VGDMTWAWGSAALYAPARRLARAMRRDAWTQG
jgi:hypothetical protein